MTESGEVSFDRVRVQAIIELLERMAAGDTTVQLPLSENRDELDAISHGINVLSDELRYASTRMAEAERRRTADLLKARDSGRATG